MADVRRLSQSCAVAEPIQAPEAWLGTAQHADRESVSAFSQGCVGEDDALAAVLEAEQVLMTIYPQL